VARHTSNDLILHRNRRTQHREQYYLRVYQNIPVWVPYKFLRWPKLARRDIALAGHVATCHLPGPRLLHKGALIAKSSSCPNTRHPLRSLTLYDAAAREPYDSAHGAYRGDSFVHFLQRRCRSRSYFQETLASYWLKNNPICRSTVFLGGYEEVYPLSSR
jgi:hypothetical protein